MGRGRRNRFAGSYHRGNCGVNAGNVVTHYEAPNPVIRPKYQNDTETDRRKEYELTTRGMNITFRVQTDTIIIKDMKHKSLVAFFSRAEENYNVGYIEKGNTEITAEIIARLTGADLFRIETTTPYPSDYRSCTETAGREKNGNARPEIKNYVQIENYDIVFIGYPIWWEDMPMAVYTFIGQHDWHGKTVIPFCTHEGSGLSGTERNIASACKGATILKGIAIRGTIAQRSESRTEQTVAEWLKRLRL